MTTENKKLNLLSLDGGGIRGLSTLYILKRVMETVNPNSPPKPCEYFDMIAGTSTGGLIAIMLGRLKMTVDECIEAYSELASQAFTRKALLPVTITGKIKARFDSEQLEQALKKVIADRCGDPDAPMRDPDTSCRVVLCATRGETTTIAPLRSYRTVRGCSELDSVSTIWQAGRATSAACSYFDPVSIGKHEQQFLDGATGANNPIRYLWVEAKDVWPSAPLEDQIGCILSVGTGVTTYTQYKKDKLGELKRLIDAATETEKTERSFAEQHFDLVANNKYFRFNVPEKLTEIGLEKISKSDLIVDMTLDYLKDDAVGEQINACAVSVAKARPRSPWEVTGMNRARKSLEQGYEKAANRPSACVPAQPGQPSRKEKCFGLFGNKISSIVA